MSRSVLRSALRRAGLPGLLAVLVLSPGPAAADEPVHPWERLGVNLAGIYG